MRASLVLVFIVGMIWKVSAQQNPFDLSHRLPKSDQKTAQNKDRSKVPPSESQVQPKTSEQNENESGQNSAEDGLGKGADSLILSPDNLRDYFSSVRSNQVFHFWYYSILAIFLALVINIDRSSIGKLFKSVTNLNYLNLMYRDQRNRYRPQYVLFAILFVLSAAFFVKHALGYLWGIDLTILYSSMIIGGIYIVRHLVMELISFAFPGNTEINQYSYSIFVFNIILGISLLLINLFLAFSKTPGIAEFCIYLGLFLVLLQYGYRSARGLLLSANLIYRNKFRFFMYLCILEIAPIFLIISIFRQF